MRSLLVPSSETDAVVAVSLSATDRSLLSKLCEGQGWSLRAARRLSEASRFARSEMVGALVCDRDLPGGSWQKLFEQVRDLPHSPKFIVTSRLADERLWSEVLNLGGYDVLASPFDPEELRRVLLFAMSPRWPRSVRRGRAASGASFR